MILPTQGIFPGPASGEVGGSVQSEGDRGLKEGILGESYTDNITMALDYEEVR